MKYYDTGNTGKRSNDDFDCDGICEMNEETVGSKLKYKLNFCLLTKKEEKTVKEKCQIKKEGNILFY